MKGYFKGYLALMIILSISLLAGCGSLGNSGQTTSVQTGATTQVQAATQYLTQSVTNMENTIASLAKDNPDKAQAILAATGPVMDNLKTVVETYSQAIQTQESITATDTWFAVAKEVMGQVIDALTPIVGQALLAAVGL